jgi:hypothetical protein
MPATRRTRTALVAALLAAIVLAAGGVLFVRSAAGPAVLGERAERATDDAPGGDAQDRPAGEPAAADPEADEDALDATDDSFGFEDFAGDGPGSIGEGSGGPLDPAGSEGTAFELCEGVLAAGDALLITPDPLVLPSGQLSGAITITNCDDEAVDWTAQVNPKVTLAHSGGNLLPGSSTLLAFTIDGSAYEPGAIEFKVKVMEPGNSEYVDVSAFRNLVGADMVADVGLTAGPQAGGCANQCITSAQLTSVFNSPDVNLDVRTNVPAQLWVWVSTEAPLDVGFPLFMGVPPAGQSLVFRTAWTTGIGGLEADTTYHIVVRAIDGNGNRSYRQGTFHTATPVEQPGDLLDVGEGAACWVQCITEAVVTPDSLSADLHVETHTSAILDAYVSVDAPSEGPGGIPTFPGLSANATTDGLDVTSWDATLTGLLPDTTYHVVVRATDLHGGRSYRAGTFRTDPGDQYLVRIEQIRIVGDGDDGGSNRGELSFRWGTDTITLGGRGEQKIASESTVHLDDHNGVVAVDDGGDLPELVVAAAERDADGLNEFCAAGSGVVREPEYMAGCDLKINVATSTPVGFDSLDDRLRCSHYGIDERPDAACFIFESVQGLGGDYASFWVVASVELVG